MTDESSLGGGMNGLSFSWVWALGDVSNWYVQSLYWADIHLSVHGEVGGGTTGVDRGLNEFGYRHR